MKAPKITLPKVVFSILMSVAAAPRPAAAADKSVDLARSFVGGLITLSQHSREANGKTSDGSTKQVQALSAEIDFEKLARKSFGPNRWAKFAAPERKDFLATFQELLEVVAYPKAQRITAKPEEIAYSVVPQHPGQVQALGSFEHERRGEVVQQKLELVLVTDPKEGRIVDAVIEGEMLSTNLKRQFDNALKTKTLAQITAQMKKRVTEAKANP